MRSIETTRIRITSVIALLFAAAGCQEEAVVAVVPPPPVAAAPVIAHDVEEHIEVTGEIDAALHAVIAAEVSGRVTQIVVDSGSPVAKGDTVIEIDPQRRELELQAQRARVQQAKATLAKERRQAARIRRLHEQNAESGSALDEAETAVEVAAANLAAEEAQLGVAQQALADASVIAPFDGIVGDRKVDLGEYVQPGKEILEFVSLDPLQVTFYVSEVDSGRVQLGQKVRIAVAPYPDERFEAVVDVIYPALDVATRSLRVRAQLANPDERLRPGLFARADLGIDVRRGVAMVSETAVLQRADGAVVFQLHPDDRVSRRRVEIGEIRDGLIEIREGVSVGDVIVTRGHAELIDGSLVAPVQEDGSARIAGGGSGAGTASTP